MAMTDAQTVEYAKSAIARDLADKAVAMPNSNEPTTPKDRADTAEHTDTPEAPS